MKKKIINNLDKYKGEKIVLIEENTLMEVSDDGSFAIEYELCDEKEINKMIEDFKREYYGKDYIENYKG